MKLILSTHNVTLTKAIEDHIISRIEKLEHLDPTAIDARVIFEFDDLKVRGRQPRGDAEPLNSESRASRLSRPRASGFSSPR